jgi:hypothetical protein
MERNGDLSKFQPILTAFQRFGMKSGSERIFLKVFKKFLEHGVNGNLALNKINLVYLIKFEY